MLKLHERDGWVNDYDPQGVTADEAKAIVCELIEEAAALMRMRRLQPVSPYEAASWPLKLAEANAGGGPMLNAEAQARGCAASDLVEKVLANAAAYSALESAIAGTSGRHRDAVRALQSVDEIIAYDWRDGWPE